MPQHSAIRLARWLAASAALVAFVACGNAPVTTDGPTARPAPLSGLPSQSSGPVSTVSTPSATPAPTTPPTHAAALPTVQQMAAAMSTQTFAIVPLVAGGASGSVTVTASGSAVHYHVVVTGLAPGSRHTIHDHLGRCSSAGASEHVTVLATPAANRAGVIVFDTTVGPFLAGAGRIVIVYATGSPNLITGCADL